MPATANVPPLMLSARSAIRTSSTITPPSVSQYGTCSGRATPIAVPGIEALAAGSRPVARRRVPGCAAGAAPGRAPGRPARRMPHRISSGTQVSPLSPMYALSGLISLLSACCSMMWAVQPAIRLTEKTGVNRSVGIPR